MPSTARTGLLLAIFAALVGCAATNTTGPEQAIGGTGGEEAGGTAGMEVGGAHAGGSTGGNGGNRPDASVGGNAVDAGIGPAPRDASGTDVGNDPRSKRWVFLLIGQSNMAGQASCEASDAQAPARVFKLTTNKTWVPGTESFNIAPFVPADGAACSVCQPFMGPGRAFGAALVSMVADAQVEVYVINVAVRGSAIESWDPKGANNNFTNMLPYLAEGMKRGVLMGVLWHQGESNGATPRAEYVNKLEALVQSLRTRAQRSDLPFVAGEIGATGAANNINLALRDLAAKDKHFVVASSAGLKLQNDNVHYDTATQREYGKRYAKAWFTLSGQ